MSYIIKNYKENSNFEMSKSWDMLGENQKIIREIFLMVTDVVIFNAL